MEAFILQGTWRQKLIGVTFLNFLNITCIFNNYFRQNMTGRMHFVQLSNPRRFILSLKFVLNQTILFTNRRTKLEKHSQNTSANVAWHTKNNRLKYRIFWLRDKTMSFSSDTTIQQYNCSKCNYFPISNLNTNCSSAREFYCFLGSYFRDPIHLMSMKNFNCPFWVDWVVLGDCGLTYVQPDGNQVGIII